MVCTELPKLLIRLTQGRKRIAGFGRKMKADVTYFPFKSPNMPGENPVNSYNRSCSKYAGENNV